MLTAHMFVFYYGMASSLAPPVANAAYAAAPIAGSNSLITAFMLFRLGMAKFIIPFVFAFYLTILIIEEFSFLPFIWIVARTCFCIWLFSSALSAIDRRKLSIIEVVVRFITAFACLAVNPIIHMPAVALGLILVLFGRHILPAPTAKSKGNIMKRKPNFLFIITDQHRADHLGCYGNQIVRTPAIDSLAKKGSR